MLLIKSTAIHTPDITGLDCIDHGGGCCGIMHIQGFPCRAHHGRLRDISDETRVEWIKRAVSECIYEYDASFNDDPEDGRVCYADDWVMVCEVTLAGYQIADWREPLEKVGFHEVTVFENSNSGNMVHIFHLVTSGTPE